MNQNGALSAGESPPLVRCRSKGRRDSAETARCGRHRAVHRSWLRLKHGSRVRILRRALLHDVLGPESISGEIMQ